MNYDPTTGPDPEWWLELDEAEQIDLVIEHHEDPEEWHPELPNIYAHAAMHTAVENQVALNDPPVVAATLERLQKQGLVRHDALHAIAYVLAQQMDGMLEVGKSFSQSRYSAKLKKLTAKKWQRWGK